jgi:ribosomal protein S18 acetylase RimI-like enzyme
MAEIGYRAATPGDREWLYELKRVTMGAYVSETYGWDESFQRHRFEENFKSAAVRILQVDGEDAGMLDFAEEPDRFTLNRIELLPKFQRRGLGGRILRELIEEARRRLKPVDLQVLRVNPAKGLYERLGFTAYEETRTHYKMRFQPGLSG